MDSCRNGCVLNWCGDGVQDLTPDADGTATEACDDGNLSDGDGCVGTCKLARCGDGLVRSEAQQLSDFEECDDGDANGPTRACTADCRRARCGDGLLLAQVEQCDDGNTVNTDGCTTACQTNVCGDGHRNPATEQCDLGPANGTLHCSAGCTLVPARVTEVEPNNTSATANAIGLSVAGTLSTAQDVDHFRFTVSGPAHVSIQVLEETGACPAMGFDPRVRLLNASGALVATMDDEPTMPPSRCPRMTPANMPALRGLAAGSYTVVVDTLAGLPLGPYHLAVTVTPNACGDGYVGGTEQCDDGNTADLDGCSAVCRTVCGDGQRMGAEQCDDGNAVNGDGCSSACLAEYQPEQEANDTPGTANVLQAGRPGFSATSDANSGYDFFAVDVPEGHSLLVEVQGTCNAVSTLDVRTSTNVQLEGEYGYYSCVVLNPVQRPRLAALAAGRYVIRVLTSGVAGTAYRIRLAVMAPGCGNSIAEPTEECDHGNLVDGDGCSSSCTLEDNWTREREPNAFPVVGSATPVQTDTVGVVGRLSAATDVDHYMLQVPSTGLHQLSQVALGDGLGGCPGNFVVSVRSDTGTTLAETSSCTAMTPATHPALAALAPGARYFVVVSFNSSSPLRRPYAVRLSLVPASCGDRTVQAPEQCDDGNAAAGDGCSPVCQLEGAFTPEEEPNEYPLPGYATPLAMGDTAFVGAMTNPGEVDVYAFTVPASGPHNLQAEFSAPDDTCPFSATLELLDDQGSGVPLATHGGGYYTGCAHLEPLEHDGAVGLAPGATYYLRVKHNGSGGRRWVYVVNLTLTPVTCGDGRLDLPEECEGAGNGCDANCRLEGAWQREVEPNGDVGEALFLESGSLGFIGRLQGSADRDTYGFTVPDGASANLVARISNGRGGCDRLVTLNLQDRNGFTLVTAPLPTTTTCASIDAAVNARAWGLAPGRYHLSLGAPYTTGQSGTLPYALSVVLTAPVCGNGRLEGGEECDDGNMQAGDGCSACAFEASHLREVEPNNTSAQATVLGLPSGKGALPPSDQDFWRIQVTQPGHTLVASVSNGLGGCPTASTRLVLRTTSGATLATASPGPDGCPRLNGSVPGAANLAVGAYDLNVGPNTAYEDVFVPSYVLTWTTVPPSCGDGVVQGTEECDDGNTLNGDTCSSTCISALSIEAEPNGTLATATPLADAPGARGALTPAGDVDFYTFTLAQTASVRAYTANANGVGCPGDTLLELRDTTGAVLASDDDDGDASCSLINGATADAGARMLAPGTYVLVVKAYAPSTTMASYGVFIALQ